VAICDGLRKSAVRWLDLSCNRWCGESARLLGSALAASTALTSLNLVGCCVERTGCAALFDGLGQNSSLLELDISCQTIGNGYHGLRCPASRLPEISDSPTLKRSWASTGLPSSDQGKDTFCAEVFSFPATTSSLSRPSTSPGESRAFTLDSPSTRPLTPSGESGAYSPHQEGLERLQTESTPRATTPGQLRFSQARVGTPGTVYSRADTPAAAFRAPLAQQIPKREGASNSNSTPWLGAALTTNSTLQVLRLSGAGAAWWPALIEGVQRATQLSTLEITNTNLAVDGVRRLAACSTLTKLTLSSCKVGGVGCGILAKGICQGPLAHLDLSGNRVGAVGGERMGAALASSTALRSLVMRSCDLGSGGCAGIGYGAAASVSCTSMDLSDNLVGADGARALSSALKKCRCLATLRLSGCSLTGKLLADLSPGVSCGYYRSLDVSRNDLG